MIENSAWIIIGIGQVAFVLFVVATILYFKNKNLSATILKLQGSSSGTPLSTDSYVDSEESGGLLIDADIAEISPESTDQKELLSLKRKIEVYEKTIENLEKLRSLFFEIRKKSDQLQLSHAQLIDDVKNLTSTENSEKILRSLESISLEKEQLEAHLSQIESELEILTDEIKTVNTKDKDLDSNNKEKGKDLYSKNSDGLSTDNTESLDD